jgi:hypothetical protein
MSRAVWQRLPVSLAGHLRRNWRKFASYGVLALA